MSPTKLAAAVLLASITLAVSAALADRGVQTTPDGRRVLVQKDVGDERWVITLDQGRDDDWVDDTISGNVFFTDGRPPAFVFCVPDGARHLWQCGTAGSCVAPPCGQFDGSRSIGLPIDFFRLPSDADQCGGRPSVRIALDVETPSVNGPLSGYQVRLSYSPELEIPGTGEAAEDAVAFVPIDGFGVVNDVQRPEGGGVLTVAFIRLDPFPTGWVATVTACLTGAARPVEPPSCAARDASLPDGTPLFDVDCAARFLD